MAPARTAPGLEHLQMDEEKDLIIIVCVQMLGKVFVA